MKAITIKQPWATLIALGLKQFETRSWQTKHRGPIAIHAGKSVDKEAYHDFANVLKAYEINSIQELPTGAVIALARLDECHRVTTIEFEEETNMPIVNFECGSLICGDEYDYGWYEKGRYAWQLSDVKPIDPVPVKGQLSLWTWEGK